MRRLALFLFLALPTTLSGERIQDDGVLLPRDLPAWKRQKGWIPIRLPTFLEAPPKGSILDFSPSLDAPAGKHGFVKVGKDRRLVFGDGTPARFWATHLVLTPGKGDKKLTKRDLSAVADRLASLGCNGLRIFIGTVSSRVEGDDTAFTIDPEKMDLYDFVLAECRKRGIYYWLTLQDGGAAGNGFFQRVHIDRRKAFFKAILHHRNPYTGLRYVDDPALALVQCLNEMTFSNGLTKDFLLGYYRGDQAYETFMKGWNRWLRRTYGSRAALVKAWTRPGRPSPLAPDEDPVQGTVKEPCLLFWYWQKNAKEFLRQRRNQGRATDFLRYGDEVEISHGKEMRRYLKRLGLRVPVNVHCGAGRASWAASHHSNVVVNSIDSWGAYVDLSFSSHKDVMRARFRNFEWLHDPVGYLPFQSRLPPGRPATVYEWNVQPPHEWRANVSFSLLASWATQGHDWMSHFCIGNDDLRSEAIGSGAGGWHRWDKGRHWYAWRNLCLLPDPALTLAWMCAGEMYRRADIATGPVRVGVGMNELDWFWSDNDVRERPEDFDLVWPILNGIAWVERASFDGKTHARWDLLMSSGKSALPPPDHPAKHRMLFSGRPWTDRYMKVRDPGAVARKAYPSLRFRTARGMRAAFEFGYSSRRVLGPVDVEAAVELDSIPSSAEPVGVDENLGLCLGFFDDRDLVVPDVMPFAGKDAELLPRLLLEAGKRWGLWPRGGETFDVRESVSGTGEVVRNFGKRITTLDAPRAQVVTGFPGGQGAVALKDLGVDCRTGYATICALSRDGQALSSSGKILLLAIGRVENTGFAFKWVGKGRPERIGPDRDLFLGSGRRNLDFQIADPGKTPMLFEPIDADVTLRHSGKLRVLPLDPATGRPAGRPLAVRYEGGVNRFRIGSEQRTVCYELVPE